MLRLLRSLSPALAVALLAAPAAANAAPAAKSAAKSKTASSARKATTVYPTVSSISPRKITIGEKLTITGAHFRAGKGKTSVAFYKSGKPVIFATADTATTTKLVVTIPTKVGTLLSQSNGQPVRTLLRIRVIGAKMGRTWTKNSRSPLIAPVPPVPLAPGTDPNSPVAQQQAAAIAYQSCQQQAAANPAGDQDGDVLSNATEAAYKLDPCLADTDGDTFSDGYEYYAAIDLNGSATPYPGTRPWPNPLDPSDGDYDFDGDGLLLWQEYQLWKASGAGFPLTQYSDGSQSSGGPVVPTAAQQWLDLDGDGNLTDNERDFDGDGLSNFTEYNGRGTQNWWRKISWRYQPHGTATSYTEPWYAIRLFSDPDPTVADSDGDGILDGADDQDNDGWSNVAEMQISRAAGGYRVHPYNPCLPDPHSRVCSRTVPLEGTAWPPFDKVDDLHNTGMVGDAIPFAWPVVNYATWYSAGPLDPYYAPGSNNPTHVVVQGWDPWVFGPWDPAGWFTGGWDGDGGTQGP
jgi:IPT/TIG domain-containing protein